MRILTLILMPLVTLSFVAADDGRPFAPPKHLRASWAGLEKANFSSWIIEAVSYGGECADGGSKVFILKTTKGKSFKLLATNPAYWTEEDIKLRRQVFYLIYDKKFYKVGIKTKGESNLIAMLEAARKKVVDKPTAELSIYRGLIARIKNRVLPK